jgi:murein DD-endopeptidase MepM/ murein hydrolase activator NlpD
MRSIAVFVFCVLSVSVLGFGVVTQMPSEQASAAPQLFAVDEIPPGGGGEFAAQPMDEITEAKREQYKREINENIARLEAEGRLAPATTDAVPLIWPVQKAASVTDFHVDAISNYVDHNAAFPNQIRDWNCGTRTYDQPSGYNHAGIDIFLWPFIWRTMDLGGGEIVAAAPGTIVNKIDGNQDRSCSFNSSQWNAVYIRHADNSIAWYGHMKNGSTINKNVGDTVVAGEKLGLVGSSGNSSGPHLHFELYDANGQLRDPFQGPCNLMNANSWWVNQQPYRIPRMNGLTTGGAPPVFPTCPNPEIPNIKTTFAPGEPIFTTAHYRDQLAGVTTQFSLVRPDGTAYQSWTQTVQQNYNASWWWWSWSIPANAPTGTWLFRAVLEGNTFETPFVVAAPVATVSGRVTTPGGQNLRNATVSLIDANNVRRTATTSSFGLYSFDNVAIGGSYTISVANKRYRFTPQIHTITGNLSNVDFVGQE